jgi:hypothetical protein
MVGVVTLSPSAANFYPGDWNVNYDSLHFFSATSPNYAVYGVTMFNFHK